MWKATMISVLALVSLAAAGVVGSFIFWPSTWSIAQQVSLAVPIIGFFGLVFSTVAKLLFDQISINTGHALEVRGKLLERFVDSSVNYLNPMGSYAGELQKYLNEFKTAKDRNETVDQQAALVGSLYFLGRYLWYQDLLRGNRRLRDTPNSDGVFLETSDSEELVWGLLMQAWAFGINTFADQAKLIKDVESYDQVEFAEVYGGDLATSRIIFDAFSDSLVEEWPDKIDDLITTLYAFNRVLAKEVANGYGVWYRRSLPYPRDELAKVLAIPEHRRDRIGILFGDSKKLAIQKASPRWRNLPFVTNKYT